MRVRIPSLIILVGLAAACLPASRAEDGWTRLFDGKSLDGWRMAAHGKARYEVVDGTIHGTTVKGSPNSFLITEEEYGDFELRFEVRVHDSLNSGVQIRSREKTEEDVATEKERTGKAPRAGNGLGRFFGPQVEIESSPGQAGYIYGEATGRGWLSAAPQDTTHEHRHIRNGEWNQYRIVAEGPRIRVWINGEMVEDLSDEEIFKTHPKGHIGLQVHGIRAGTGPFDVSWRDLKLRKL